MIKYTKFKRLKVDDILDRYNSNYGKNLIEYIIYDNKKKKTARLHIEIPIGEIKYNDKEEAMDSLAKQTDNITKTHLNNAVQSLNYSGKD